MNGRARGNKQSVMAAAFLGALIAVALIPSARSKSLWIK